MKLNTSIRAPQIDALTSIRFFFAAMVIVGHFSSHFAPGVITASNGFLFYNAPIAVSWFFILSGFVIAYNYPRLPTGADRTAFVISRFARLWPVHIITLFAAVLIQGGGKYYPFFLTMTHTWTASPDMSGAYNGPSWSISNEFFFYVCYVGLAAPLRWIRVVVTIAPIVASLALLLSLRCYLPVGEFGVPRQCGALVVSWPPTRFVEFLAGVAICRWGVKLPQIVGLSIALSVWLGYFPSLPYLDGNPILQQISFQFSCIVGGGALIASLSKEGWLSRLLSFRPLVIGGEISYAMYMTHQIVNWSLYPYLKSLDPLVTFGVLVITTIVISTLLFYLVEAPVRDSVKRWLKRRNGALPSEQFAISTGVEERSAAT
jgi:peptidoglycan/LPS O-acetylase OafA/YrhL